VVNTACSNVSCHLGTDFHSSLPEVVAQKIDNICSMICQRIQSTGTDSAMAQPGNDLGNFDEDSLDCVLEELIEQPDNSFNRLSSFVAATEASMRFSAVLPAIASSNPPGPCSNSNSNCNGIPNMTSSENTGLVDGSTIVDVAMLLGG
jgi:hypothetical protein